MDKVDGCRDNCAAIDVRSKDTENKVGINNEILIKLEGEMQQIHEELGTITKSLTNLISENK